MNKKELVQWLEKTLDTTELSGLEKASKASLLSLQAGLKSNFLETDEPCLHLHGVSVPLSAPVSMYWNGSLLSYPAYHEDNFDDYIQQHGKTIREVCGLWDSIGGLKHYKGGSFNALVRECGNGASEEHSLQAQIEGRWPRLDAVLQHGSLRYFSVADKVVFHLQKGLQLELTSLSAFQDIFEDIVSAFQSSNTSHADNKEQLTAIDFLPGAELCLCPSGSFQMGSGDEDEEAHSWEKPQREVVLESDFYALATPVTQAMYQQIMERNPSWFRGANRPVDSVSWMDTILFCNALSRMAGLEEPYVIQGEQVLWKGVRSEGYRLPTEAEWEYMSRAESGEIRYGALEDIAWYRDNSSGETQSVGLLQPNQWGLYDTLGNVREWCFDTFASEAYKTLETTDPVHLEASTRRVARGGCWLYSAKGIRAASRFSVPDDETSENLGFRVVRTVL